MPKTQSQNNTLPMTPIDQTPQQQSQPMITPTPLHRINDNTPWGNAMHLERPHNHFRLLSKNIKMLNATSLDMLAIATGLLQEINASMFLAQETKTPWNPKNLQSITQQCHQVYTNKKIATLSSKKM